MKLKPIKDKKKIEKIFEKGSFIKFEFLAVKFYDFNNPLSCLLYTSDAADE